MSAFVSSSCAVCHTRCGQHQCLQCNERFALVSDLIDHQKRFQHYGGHYILSTPRMRIRRRPVRFLGHDEETRTDADSGANELFVMSDVEHSIQVACEPSAPTTEAEKDSEDAVTHTSANIVPDATDNIPPEILTAPKWAQNVKLPGIKFNNDFSKYWCACGKTPKNGWSTGGSGGNIRKHRKSESCTYDPAQLKIGQSSKIRRLTQPRLQKLLLDAILSCNLPHRIVENKDFKSLVTFGEGRQHLHLPSRRTVRNGIDAQYEILSAKLKKSITESTSRVSITFDIWSDKVSRGFLAVTGHYFDSTYKLRSPLLSLVPVIKKHQGHTAQRIYDEVSAVLRGILGDQWKDLLFCSVTDGAANVTSASQMLGTSRRCVQHSIQLFIKYFCSSQQRIASAMACSNYLAHTSKVSQKLRCAIGVIPVGVITRWNSYLLSAVATFKARSKLNEYVDSANCASDLAPLLRVRLDYLNQGGFRVLHDVVTVLEPLAEITISQEGELYVTSSRIVPLLLDAKRHADKLFEECQNGSVSGKLLDPSIVKMWKPTWVSCGQPTSMVLLLMTLSYVPLF